MVTLKLGHFDREAKPNSWHDYLRPYHEPSLPPNSFRGDANKQWRPPKALNGTPVADLQQDLKSLGYMPEGPIDGIFGYRTHSAVILFQEYTRSVVGKTDLGSPDGLVGPKTRTALQEAINNNVSCEWTEPSKRQDGPWLALLQSARDKYRHDYPSFIPQLFDEQSDTLHPDIWQVGQAPVHVIGLRRTAWAASLDGEGKRMNNDVFVVIAIGCVMYFFGSTDPNPSMSSNTAGIPFLCKGQHKYRFGFHRLWDKAEKCYRALRPANLGVRVVRDSDRDKKLSYGDTLDPDANTTINLHWSGRGTSNWSGGCQVIGGALYINHTGRIIDCWNHAALTYNELGSRKGRGAYDLMLSWITVCSPDITRTGTIPYTLIEEDDLEGLAPELHMETIAAFRQAAQTVAKHDTFIKRFVMIKAPELLA
ncbi:MAG: peptidoglycan-binding protein [Candidatus Thiodiazotropha endolucinida]